LSGRAASSARRRLLLGAAGGLLCACAPSVPRPRLRVSAVTVPGTPWFALWTRFAERAREKLVGFAVRLLIRGELGPEEHAIAKLRRGRIEMAGLSLQGAATLVPELSLILAPYQFSSPAEADALLDGPLFPLFAERFRARGLQLLQWAEVGLTHLYARRPLRRPDAVRGLRMRASNALGARLFGLALGMNQVPISFTEVLTALETGLIEGGQSGTGLYALAGLVRHAPHLSLTAHAYDAGVVVAHAAWWDALDEATRAAIRACLDSPAAHRAEIRAFVAALEEEGLKRLGGKVHRLSETEQAAWRAAVRPVAGWLLRALGPGAEPIARLMPAFAGRSTST
jgi:TRAP-type C4-dicarboxylate transport system substrate-binding protein